MPEAAQHVGVTRGGKAVQVPLFSDEPKPELPAACASYTPADHLDAHSIFEYLLSRELSRGLADTHARSMFQNMSSSHNLKLDQEWLQTERLVLGLTTIFDVLEHGKGLTDSIFKD